MNNGWYAYGKKEPSTFLNFVGTITRDVLF